MQMDRRSNTACLQSQGGRAKPFEALGDQVWLEEVMGPFQNQSSLSQLSCPSAPSSSSPGCSSEGTGSLYSVSSGVTGRTAFQTRLGSERRWGRLTGCPFRGPRWRAHPLAQQDRGRNRAKTHASPDGVGPCQGRGSPRTHAGAKSVKLQCLLEEKIEAKVKFSQFLNEVTSNVLHPNSLRVFGRPVSPSGFPTISPPPPEDEIQEATQWSPRLPRSRARRQGSLLARWASQEEQTLLDAPERTISETDVDTVDPDVRAGAPLTLETDEEDVIPPPPQFCEGFQMTSPVPEFHPDPPPYPYRSVSLPKGINMVSE